MCLLSVLIQLPAVLVDPSRATVDHLRREGVAMSASGPYNWRLSPLVICTEASLSTVPANIRYVIGWDVPPSVDPSREDVGGFSQQFAFSLDFWWLYLLYLGVLSSSTAIVIGLLPALAAGCVWFGPLRVQWSKPKKSEK